MVDRRPIRGATELRQTIGPNDTEIPVISTTPFDVDATKRIGDERAFEFVRCSSFGVDQFGWPVMVGCERGLNQEEGGTPPRTWVGGTDVDEVRWTAVDVLTYIPTPTLAMKGRQFVYQDAEGNVYTFNVITSPDGTPIIDWVNEPPPEESGFTLTYDQLIVGLTDISGVCLDPSGNIYVLRRTGTSDQVSKYSPALVHQWTVQVLIVISAVHELRHITTDGTHVYITGNNAVFKHLCSTGAFVASYGSSGAGNGQFNSPKGIIGDGTHLYICDYINDRIQKLLASTGAYVAKTGTTGGGSPIAAAPTGICLAAGKLWFISAGEAAIKRLDPATLALELTITLGFGNAPGQIGSTAEGIDVDALGRIWISDTPNHRVQVIDSSGAFLFSIGTFGSGDRQFKSPRQLTLNAADEALIADSGNARLARVVAAETEPLVTVIATPASGEVLVYDAALEAFVNETNPSHPLTITKVTNTATAPNNAFTAVTATCPAGSKATGGGCRHNGAGNAAWIFAAEPQAASYACTFFQSSGVSITITAYAMCIEDPVS